MLGDGGLGQGEKLDEPAADAAFPSAEDLEDADADRVRQGFGQLGRPDEVRVEGVRLGSGHAFSPPGHYRIS